VTHKRYENYVDTQEAWLGSYPSHWGRKPLWTLFRRVKRQGFESEELLSVYRDHGVIPKSSREDNFNKPSDDLGAYQLVEPGDLAVNKMKAWQGSVAISEHRGIVSPAYHVYTPLHSENQRFLHYLMRCDRYITGYLSISKGIRINQWDLQPEYHSRMPVLLPLLEEQTAISIFLDSETAKIDALIFEQQRLIKLLQEKRQAVISHAVTKGLNPNAPMKDSGVEWLGEVPEHWENARLSRLTTKIGDGLHGTPEYVEESEFYFVNGNNLNAGAIAFSESTRCVCKLEFDKNWLDLNDTTLLMSINGTIGNFALYRGESIMLGKSASYINCNKRIFREYLSWIVQSHEARYYFALYSTGTTISNLGLGAIKSMPVAVPPLNEQARINDLLAYFSARNNRLIYEAELAVGLLQERRSALISAAVTGQIDVRGLTEEVAA
jgi:type I restriction enzyme, S subunit